MTLFDDVVARAKIQFPSVQIKYKNESTFMKILGKILFFNPQFMDQYITTLGNTIYFPNRDYANSDPVDAATVLLHELVHVYDSQKRSLFPFLYMLPQLLSLIFFPLFFIFGFKIALFSLLFLLPLPAYFRMFAERKAYTIELYAYNKLNSQGYEINFDGLPTLIVSQFKTSSYYFMWPFNSIDSYFSNVLTQIKNGNQPYYEAELYSIIDKILLG